MVVSSLGHCVLDNLNLVDTVVADKYNIVLNLGSSTRLYGMRLTAALCNGAVRGQPVDSHMIICHTSVTCETSLLCLYIYHIRRVNMI